MTTTPRDLMITALDMTPGRPTGQGELSLGLAGAELIDLLAAGALTLDGDRIVPAPPGPAPADRLLARAAQELARGTPHEPVADWLWRRGRGLAPAYLAALEEDGQLTREHHRWLPRHDDRPVLTDSPGRRQAQQRREANEPVLTALATAVGLHATDPTAPTPATDDDAVDTVLAAVDDAVTELAAERQRRSIERAAFDNIWRGSETAD
ncbi:hypothetical protein GCM10010218_54870 [Streptomyces mashuensis]|uniref:GPP34 family phosphoprotein n=1 Tax=Streptomyces mashuensis TaxID=33904 RepID=A0A919B7J6_9ACTN|nr:GPP34 family phosphoprotein [Streptomyces mashuensis]GHF66351.1 hypothetical protein GCM10010218_54870 [Streptomyces mashuensis]